MWSIRKKFNKFVTQSFVVNPLSETVLTFILSFVISSCEVKKFKLLVQNKLGKNIANNKVTEQNEPISYSCIFLSNNFAKSAYILPPLSEYSSMN